MLLMLAATKFTSTPRLRRGHMKFTHAKRLSAIVLALGLFGPQCLSRPQSHAEARDTRPGSPRSVITSFFTWYCELPASPAGCDLAPIRGLLTTSMHEALCTVDNVNPAERQFPFELFPKGGKPDAFRIRRVSVDADYCLAIVALTSAGRQCHVSVRLTYIHSQGWSLASLSYLRYGKRVQVPAQLPTAPPN